jgi:hypothetical protein
MERHQQDARPGSLLVPTPVAMMTTSNSQLRRPTSQPRVTTKRSKPPQRSYWLRKQNTRSAYSQLWSPHGPPSSTSTSTHSRSTEAPLINTTMTLKPQKINTEDNNPSKDRTILEEWTHENTCWVRVVWGASENETRRGRQGEGDELKWRHSFYSTHPLEGVNATWRYFTTLLVALTVNHTNFKNNCKSYYTWWIFLPTMYIQILVFEEYSGLCPW